MRRLELPFSRAGLMTGGQVNLINIADGTITKWVLTGVTWVGMTLNYDLITLGLLSYVVRLEGISLLQRRSLEDLSHAVNACLIALNFWLRRLDSS